MGKVQLPMTLVEGRKINNWFELQSRGKKSDGEIKGSIHLMIELNKNANPKSLLEPTQTIRKQRFFLLFISYYYYYIIIIIILIYII